MIVVLGLLYNLHVLYICNETRQLLPVATELYSIIGQGCHAVRHSLLPLHTLDIEESLNPNIHSLHYYIAELLSTQYAHEKEQNHDCFLKILLSIRYLA